MLAVFAGETLDLVQQLLGGGARLDEQAGRHVVLGVQERIEQHLLHLVVGEAVLGLDFDLLSGVRAQFNGFDFKNAVGVQQEVHVDFGQAGWHGGQAGERELTQLAVLAHEVALALVHGYFQVHLPVDAGGVLAAGLGRNLRVARNNGVHQPAQRFDAQREGRHIQ